MSPYGGRSFAADVYKGVKIPKAKRISAAAEPRSELARARTFTPAQRRAYVSSPEYQTDKLAFFSEEQDVPGYEFGRDCSD